jgi:hypothetical protein
MILVSMGLPSRFAEWCDDIVCALARAADGPLDLASGNTLEEIALAAIRSPTPRLVIGARQPTDELRTALAQVDSRFVVALDDPHAAFRNLVTRHGLEWTAAVRAAAGSCAAILSYTAMPGALVLRADQEGNDPGRAAAAIAHWLDLDVGPAVIAALAEGQPRPSVLSAQDRTDGWWDTISASDRAIVDGALNGYVDYFLGAGIGQMVWARDLFFIGDDPNRSASGVIDVSGPVRYLLFGPYMAVPAGQWVATIALAVSKGAENLNYSVEILAGARFTFLARGMIQPRGEGLCESSIDFTVSESTDQPIEFRIANLQNAFGGRLALAHVALAPRIRPPAEIPAELTRALGL